MTKIFSMVSHKNYNLGVWWGFCNLSDFQVNYILYWRFYFENEILVIFLFTKWKWTHILDFGPWGWSVLNMKFVNKWPSRIQEQWFFAKSDMTNKKIRSGPKNPDFFLSFLGGCPYPYLPLPYEPFGGGLMSPLYIEAAGAHNLLFYQLIIITRLVSLYIILAHEDTQVQACHWLSRSSSPYSF